MAQATSELGAVLGDFAQLLVEDYRVEDVLDRLGHYCTALLPVDGMGVLLSADGSRLEVATFDPVLGAEAEDLEVGLVEGPCTDALRQGTRVAVPDLVEAGDRYPRFAPRALAAGVRAVYGVPLTAHPGTVGVLNVLAREPVELSEEQLATIQLLGDVAMAYIANCRLRAQSSRLAAQLQEALDNRVVIEQAKGVLAERHAESPRVAYERLRAHARSHQTAVRDVAQQVMAGELPL